jgi:hypothetical protein
MALPMVHEELWLAIMFVLHLLRERREGEKPSAQQAIIRSPGLGLESDLTSSGLDQEDAWEILSLPPNLHCNLSLLLLKNISIEYVH